MSSFSPKYFVMWAHFIVMMPFLVVGYISRVGWDGLQSGWELHEMIVKWVQDPLGSEPEKK